MQEREILITRGEQGTQVEKMVASVGRISAAFAPRPVNPGAMGVARRVIDAAERRLLLKAAE